MHLDSPEAHERLGHHLIQIDPATFRRALIALIWLLVRCNASSVYAQTSPSPQTLFVDAGNGFGPDKLAIGPSQIVEHSGNFRVLDRQGGVLYELEDMVNWWRVKFGPFGGSGLTIAYDPVMHRWIAASHEPEGFGPGEDDGQVYIALSHTMDFMGKWTVFTFTENFSQGSEAGDLTVGTAGTMRLGFGGGVVAVTLLLDDYHGRNDTFAEDDSGYVILALGDIQGGTGTTPLTARQFKVAHDQFPYDEGRPVPARSFSSASGLYFLSLEEESPAVYGVSKLSFSGTEFSFSKNYLSFESAALGSDAGRVNAPQPQSTNRLIHRDEYGQLFYADDALLPDHRQIRDVMLRNGMLWAVHEGIDDSQDVVFTQWLGIRLASPRAIVQSGRIGGGGDGVSCIAPSIAVNANQDVLVGFTATGPHHFPSAGYALRYAGDAANTMRGMRIFAAGDHAATVQSSFPEKSPWADHSATLADPADPSALWTMQAYQTDYAYSRIAQVTGNVAPVITQHPQNRTVVPNTSATFSVAATGSNLQYQWYHEDEELGFGHAATVTVSSATAATAGYYKCLVSNAGGEVWSNPALLKLTTGNPGTFSFVDGAGNDLTSDQWSETGPIIRGAPFPWQTLRIRRKNGTDGSVRVAVNVNSRFSGPPLFPATDGWDFTRISTPAPNSLYFSGPGALTFADGETQKTVSVYIRPDTMVESSGESLEATLQVDPSRGAIATTPSLPLTILDDDLAPTFSQAVDYTATWTNDANRWKPQTSVTSDGIDAVQSDIAAPGADETAFSTSFSVSGTLVFRWKTAGDSGDRLRLVRHAVLSTSIAGEIPGGTDWQTFALPINNLGGFATTVDWRFLRGALSTDSMAGGFVDQIRFDPGTGGVVEFDRPAIAASESGTALTLTIKRLGHTATAGSVGVSLQGISATAGADFQALPLAVISFAAGQTSRTLTVNILPDQIAEPVETLRAVLSEQGAGTIGIGPVSSTVISIIDQPGETYATWAATKFSTAQLNNPALSGKSADPDGDGVLNVMEYALDGDPLSAASRPAPQSLFEAVAGEEVERHTLIFTRRVQSLDLTYRVQRSTGLDAWQDGAVFAPNGVTSFPAVVQLVSFFGSPVETRTVRDAVPLAPGQRAYLRLQVLCP